MGITLLWLSIIVLLISILGSISGVGGGVLYVPLFLVFLNDELNEIKYISTFLVFLGSFMNVAIEIVKKRLNYKILLVGVVFSTISILIGNVISKSINSDAVIKIIVAVTLIIVTFMLIYSEYFLKVKDNTQKQYKLNKNFYIINNEGDKINIILLSLISFIGGIITSLTGMGGGPIIMPLLIIIFSLEISSAAPISHSLIMVSSFISLFLNPISMGYNPWAVKEIWVKNLVFAIPVILGFIAAIYLKKVIKKEIYIKWLLIIVIWISIIKIILDLI
ncbi:sulfite exporter TauE/SafE family protein [Spiroplasma endosymbiont of Cantharis lateralis]|uniref:sulfite exporter TauE/SafE family protein n=1 Tax=Spiroplasma endosymbiont of Cantharis lateralis TaxID=3066277 RepID=UPI00313EAD6E